jgi:hypothetical protein
MTAKGTFLSEDIDIFVIRRGTFFFHETENLNLGD